MSEKLSQEYVDRIENHFAYLKKFDKLKISIGPMIGSTIDIAIEQDYDQEQVLTYENYDFLAKLFNTTKVTSNVYHSNGCETCDFGASDEITFTVKDIKI